MASSLSSNDKESQAKDKMAIAKLLLLYCTNSFKPADKRKYMYGGLSSGRPVTPPRGSGKQGKNKK